jgi:hypothetical protein
MNKAYIKMNKLYVEMNKLYVEMNIAYAKINKPYFKQVRTARELSLRELSLQKIFFMFYSNSKVIFRFTLNSDTLPSLTAAL